MGILNNLFGKKSERTGLSNDFVLTPIERKSINGQIYVFQYVNFKGEKLPLIGLAADYNPEYVVYSSKRPKELQPPMGNIEYMTKISDFFKDLVDINRFLNGEINLTDNSFLQVAEFICDKHIKHSGRLIDTDIYLYADLIIISKNGIWNKLKNYQITLDESAILWVKLTNHIKAKFENYVFITKYDMSNALQPKPYLVKFKN